MLSASKVPGAVLRHPSQRRGGAACYTWKSRVFGGWALTLTSTIGTRSAKPLPTHALCLCGAEGTCYITEPGGIVSVSVGNGGAPAQKQALWLSEGWVPW